MSLLKQAIWLTLYIQDARFLAILTSVIGDSGKWFDVYVEKTKANPS
jgi:hypothetical protein